MARNTTTQASVANPPVTFSLEQMNQIVAEAVAQASAKKQSAERSTDMEAKVLKAFRRRGFQDVKPRENTLTFNRWAEQGLRPKEGEKSVPVGSLRLFHRDQCRPLTAEEKAAFETKQAAKTADKLPKPSPITEAPASAPKPAKAPKRAPKAAEAQA
jgi:hypothetical protein